MNKLLILCFLLSLPLLVNANPGKEAMLDKEYKNFIKDNTKLRHEHEEKIYKMRLDFLKKSHDKTSAYIDKQAKLQEKLIFGKKEKNVIIRKQIIDNRKAFSKINKHSRKNFMRDKIGTLRKKFADKIEAKRKKFKKKLKTHYMKKQHKKKKK